MTGRRNVDTCLGALYGSALLRLRRTRRQHFGWMFLRRGLGPAVSEDMAGVMDGRQAQCGYAFRNALWVHIVPSLHRVTTYGCSCCKGRAPLHQRIRRGLRSCRFPLVTTCDCSLRHAVFRACHSYGTSSDVPRAGDQCVDRTERMAGLARHQYGTSSDVPRQVFVGMLGCRVRAGHVGPSYL